MWQVLLAAAIAGSGYFAKTLLHKDPNKPTNLSSIQNAETRNSIIGEETSSIFRFSSASIGMKNNQRKLGHNGGTKGNRVNQERKSGSVKKSGVVSVDDCKKNGKKFVVCLKKRRTSRNASSNCQSFDVKDKSSFGYGVGVGIMYMMSAGKTEIERLNAAVDETAKVVQELKAEISKRKSSCDSKVEELAVMKSNKRVVGNDDVNGVYGFLKSDEGEYPSSILTEEEPHKDGNEMEQLEAELESELLKLQVSTTSSSFQESQIVDLECELQHTNSKLVEKESELQALKDCVKRLSEFTVTCPTDEETDGQFDEAHKKLMNGNKKSTVGIKRGIDFD